jgi:hypothetical protein
MIRLRTLLLALAALCAFLAWLGPAKTWQYDCQWGVEFNPYGIERLCFCHERYYTFVAVYREGYAVPFSVYVDNDSWRVGVQKWRVKSWWVYNLKTGKME